MAMSENSQNKVDFEQKTNDVGDGSVLDHESDWTPEEEAAIRRKFDLTITPLVTLLYMLCAIDR